MCEGGQLGWKMGASKSSLQQALHLGLSTPCEVPTHETLGPNLAVPCLPYPLPRLLFCATANEPLPDLLFFSLEEVMDLSPINVVVDRCATAPRHCAVPPTPRAHAHTTTLASPLSPSAPPPLPSVPLQPRAVSRSISPSDDHHARVAAWRVALQGAIDSAAMAGGASAAYQFVGQSTQVGLALLVFGSRATSKVLANASTANVKTGWGGLLGNKGSCFWRAELGPGGPSICAVASHFASGRENVEPRNDCFAAAISSKVLSPRSIALWVSARSEAQPLLWPGSKRPLSDQALVVSFPQAFPVASGLTVVPAIGAAHSGSGASREPAPGARDRFMAGLSSFSTTVRQHSAEGAASSQTCAQIGCCSDAATAQH